MPEVVSHEPLGVQTLNHLQSHENTGETKDKAGRDLGEVGDVVVNLVVLVG